MILIARPHPHLERTLAAIAKAGLSAQAVTVPLSHPQPLAITVPSGAGGLIFTSAFGIHPALPKLPTCCVGEHTAQAAESMGFPVIIIGTSDAESLAQSLTKKRLKPQMFIHAHGDKAAFTWHKTLAQAGHRVVPLLTYKTQPAQHIPLLQANQLRQHPPTHTLLFSVESAKHLAKLLKEANIPPAGTAVAISGAVAKAAKGTWPKVVTASSASLAGVVSRLKKELA
ncbi:MAG: hypothetical protein GC129_01835 [Proteobacteria bacterium]|nr:hypothetical protein [Pseudomonadota bacterium]